LTYADSLVPVAFGFPEASGDENEDTLLADLRQFLNNPPADKVRQTPFGTVDDRMVEADALRRFFGLPARGPQ
jgi:hypothetical protein